MKLIVYNGLMVPAEIDGKDLGIEVHGKRFIVHKTPRFPHGPVVDSRIAWGVTETSTGFSILRGRTRKEVIVAAKELLPKIPPHQMEAAVTRAMEKLRKAGVKP